MLGKLKSKSLQKKIELLISKRDVSKRNSSLKRLGFLVDESSLDNIEVLYEFAMEIGIQPKDAKIFTYVETKKRLPTLRSNQITNKEFSWKGEIKSADANEFLDIPFDVLIGLYNEEHQYLDMMIVNSDANFKVGFAGADERLFDLVLSVEPKDLKAVGAELKKYLKILNKI